MPWPRCRSNPRIELLDRGSPALLDDLALLPQYAPITPDTQPPSNPCPLTVECQPGTSNYIIEQNVMPVAAPQCRGYAPNHGAPAIASEEALFEWGTVPTRGRIDVPDMCPGFELCVPVAQACSPGEVYIFEIVEEVVSEKADIIEHLAA